MKYKIYASRTAPWAVIVPNANQRAYFDTWEEAKIFVLSLILRDALGYC
jgi:hypothetical protein